MFANFRHFLVALPVGVALLAADPARAAAGWMGFRNDTAGTLVLQETVASRPARPFKLYANETVRDTPPTAGAVRVYAVYDAAHRDKPLYTGQFRAPLGEENVLYVIKPDGKGGVKIETVRTPVTTGMSKKVPAKR
jgi:hypothetical protein